MLNFDSITNKIDKKFNRKLPYIPDHCGSGSRKTNALTNLINEQNDIDKIYLYARDLSEPKHNI